MLVNNRSLVITDPCYVFNDKDWGKHGLHMTCPEEFSDYIFESTIYGDWGCTTYSKDGNPIGEFCADAGTVCVLYKDEVEKYNPNFFKESPTHIYTVIPNFTGKVEYEVGDYEDAHIVGYDKDGEVIFYTKQTSL